MPSVSLQYLECRARGQALRLQLADSDVVFDDRRLPIENLRESWKTIVDDPRRVGPFAALPVLVWDGFQLAQVLPIASFLDARLGVYADLGAERVAQIQMLASAAHLDVTVPIALLAWQPILHPGTPLVQSATGLSQRVSTKLRQLDAAWPQGAPFAGGERPCSADYAAFEALEAVRLFLGLRVDEGASGCPRLSRLAAALLERSAFASCHEQAPLQFSGSPIEMKVRASIQNMAGTTRGS